MQITFAKSFKVLNNAICSVLQGKLQKNGRKKFKKMRKQKVLIFGKIAFFVKAILPIENDDSTRESKYIRNYMQPNVR